MILKSTALDFVSCQEVLQVAPHEEGGGLDPAGAQRRLALQERHLGTHPETGEDSNCSLLSEVVIALIFYFIDHQCTRHKPYFNEILISLLLYCIHELKHALRACISSIRGLRPLIIPQVGLRPTIKS